MKRGLSIAGLVLVTAIWGGGFVASDIALDSLAPMQIMAIRFLLGAVLMGLISLRELKRVSPKEIVAGVLMGIALFAAFALQIIGLQYTTPSKNAFLTALNVVMVPFIAFLVLHKRIGWRGILGAVLSVVGVAVLSLNGDMTLGLGDALSLMCAVGFAFQIFFTGIFVQRYRATVLNCVQMVTAFVLSLAAMLAMGETDITPTADGWWSVLYLGVVSTTICYLLQTACQQYVDETKAAIILSMESVFGTLFSIILLGEIVTPRMVAGCAIILVAVVISNLATAPDTTAPDAAAPAEPREPIEPSASSEPSDMETMSKGAIHAL